MPFTIAVLHHWHDGADDISVHPDEDTAVNTLYPWVTTSWDNIHCPDGSHCRVPDCTGVPRDITTLTRADAIATYFAHRPEPIEYCDPYTYDVEYPETPEWVKHPGTTTGVNHLGVTGRLHIAFTGADTVFVTTETDAPLLYRNKPFRAAVHLTRGTDGTWAPDAKPEPRLTHQHGYPTRDAPPTFVKPLMGAIVHTVTENWTPALGERAQHASATNRLRTLAERRDKLLAELATITAEAAPLWQIVRNYTGPTNPAA